ncbi:MAG: FUN14 domain-containing protein [Verrucomicrobiales bacterium]|nr:FUN14 domain-containing protein [Verrucomicrobiales bacterium]MCP5525629.1 FUN14 domain-containing protein [Verrucomicrobiales bacterium]
MSNPPASAPSPTIRQSLGLDRHPLTGLKAVALVAAILMMVGGAVIAFTVDRPETPAATAASRSASTPSGGGLLGNSFGESRPGGAPASAGTPSATAEPANEDALGLHDLSPFMLKGGFGLFIGFAMGFAVRAFLRLAMVIVGFYCLLLTMMAYLGWVEVHWNLMENQFTQFTTLLSSQLQSFKSFLTGAIPALGMTAGGFLVGLRRR